MIRVHLLYALSGFLSLGYQVAWLRIYVDRFGSSDLTFVLVLSNFIGGLGAGALASRAIDERLARRPALRDPLRRYGLVELLVAASALLTAAAAFVPPDLVSAFPYALREGIYEPLPLHQLVKVAVATACVFAPCFLMGITFPLLCHAFRGDARFPSALYAWNTFGACSGVLACEFVLVPWAGHDAMFLGLVAANALLGAYFLATGFRGAVTAGPVADPVADAPAPPGGAGLALGALLLCAVLSGLLSGALEADAFKRLKFLGIRTSAAMSFVSFWAVLAIFLGSAAVRALPRLGLAHLKLAYLAALLAYVAITQHLIALHELVFGWLAPPETQSVSLVMRLLLPAGLLPLWAYVGVVVFPAFLAVSLLLPWVCNRIQGGRRHLGLAYGANTLAFCVGTIAFTWVAPRVSIFYSLKLVLAVFAIAVAALLLVSERRRLSGWVPATAVLALALACALTPRGFDRSYLIPRTPPTVEPVRAVRSDSSFTTFVVESDDGDLLYFDNVSLSNTSPRQQTYMGLMAHFPLLAHPAPADVLLICYGVGNTAAAIAAHETVRAIDVVELSRNVLLTAPEFAEWNRGVHVDPRVRFIHDDGRSFLRASDRRYDLVTSEPPPPLHVGVDRLYSREYYRDARARLTPTGMMSQWVPVLQMPQEAVDRVIATFLDVFPHALLFSGMREELVLVGSGAPIDLRVLERRFGASPAVSGHLAQLGVPNAEALLARLVQGDAALRRHYGGARVITDAHNDLARLTLDPTRPGAVPFAPRDVLGWLRSGELESFPRLRSALLHLGRLQHLAPGFPVSSLVAMEEGDGVTGAGVDWGQVARLEQEADRLAARGQRREARDTLLAALALFPEQPKLLRRQARLEVALGAPEAALEALRRFVALEPEDAEAQQGLAALLEARGDLAPAASAYRRALALDPRRPLAALRLAGILATAPDPALRDGGEALRRAEEALAGYGDRRPEALAALAAAHAERGDFAEAVRWQRAALALAPAPLGADYRAALAGYEQGEPLRRGEGSGRPTAGCTLAPCE